jgi:exonuclease-1
LTRWKAPIQHRANMGVKELFPQLKGAQRRVCLLECLRGTCVGVDAYVWLHIFAIRHAAAVVLNNDFRGVAAEFLQRAKWLLRCGTTPTFVFDGARLPAKDSTAAARSARRAKAFAEAEVGEDAEPCPADLRAAIKIEHGMVRLVIAALRTSGFHYVVAPYEADAQLVHLVRTGCIESVISVDSDLVALGATTVYCRVNYFTGDATVLHQKDLGCADPADVADKDVTLRGLVHKHGLPALHAYALLAGCDYDCHCPGIGQKKARGIIRDAGVDVADIVRHVEAVHELGLTPPPGWERKMRAALDCFLHPIVYDLETGAQRAMSNEDVSGKPHLGVVCDPAKAAPLALGTVHPDTGEDVDLPAVQQMVQDGDIEPMRLTFEMVKGSVSCPPPPCPPLPPLPPCPPCPLCRALRMAANTSPRSSLPHRCCGMSRSTSTPASSWTGY